MSTPAALLVFGDSLSDSGNAYFLSGQVLKVPIPPDSAGYNGWFSNGLIQSGVTAGLLGTPMVNYAVGGARAVGSRTVQQYLEQNDYDAAEIMRPDPDPVALATDTYLNAQLQRYLAGAALAPPPADALATLWFGANDYNALPEDATLEEAALLVGQVVQTILAAAGAIGLSGVGRVMLYNLPSPDFLPVTLPPNLSLVVDAHNLGLAQGAAALRGLGIDAGIVDMHRMSTEIMADPRSFGLNPAYLDQPLRLGLGSQPTWIEAEQNWFIEPNPAVAGVDPDTVQWADFLHPSSATHGVLGSFAAASITDNLVFLGSDDEVRRTGSLDDLVLAGGGDDRIFSEGGEDIVLAGLGDDSVMGGAGRDIVVGGGGNDRVHGNDGDDVVAGSDGDDFQTGGAGDDVMIDGLGFDRIFGNGGNDAFVYTEASRLGGSNRDDGGRFNGGSGFDTLYLALDAETAAAVQAELRAGATSQQLDTIGVTTRSIEHYVFVDPDDLAACIGTGARIAEADLWGIL